MSNELALAQHNLCVGSIGSYIHWVNQIPMLTAEEEYELATRLHEHNDLESARKLIMSHLRLVVKIARGYNGYGLQQADLIQEGNIGLMKAVKRFDPKIGVRLVSFAIHWIRAEIHEFVLRNWRIVKVATTKAQRKLFFNLRKAAKEGNWFSAEEAATVAEELNVSIKDVRQMEQRLHAFDASFDALAGDEDNDGGAGNFAPSQYLEDHSSHLENNFSKHEDGEQRETKLHRALTILDQRSRDILHARWLDDKKQTLHDLAAKYQVSAERIRQLEKNAMKKLREAMLS